MIGAANMSMGWMSDMRDANTMITLQQAKAQEFAQKFSQQVGGGIADDIEF